nr:OmpA family protein [Pseudoduganella violacea]
MHPFVHLVAVAAAIPPLVTVAACTPERARPAPAAVAPVPAAIRGLDQRTALTQWGYGAAAYYGQCRAGTCPARSPKTFIDASAGAAMPAALPKALDEISARPRPDARTSAETAVIHFSLGSAQLDDSARNALLQFLPLAPQARRIEITGRTDSSGGERINHALAQARAQAVHRYLRQQLPPGMPVRLAAAGRCCYVADNVREEGRQANRRAEVTFHLQQEDGQ